MYNKPPNHGKPWRQQEIDRLRRYLRNQNGTINFQYLGGGFGRTAFAIQCAVEKLMRYDTKTKPIK